jgi:hypothetical protein
VVLESNDTQVQSFFKKVALENYEKYDSLMVTHADPDYEFENGNYDNCYVVGPRDYIQRYLIPKHEMLIDMITEGEIRNVFQISSLPKALVLRDTVIESEQFLQNFGEHTIYVALIDSKNESFPAEFGF